MLRPYLGKIAHLRLFGLRIGGQPRTILVTLRPGAPAPSDRRFRFLSERTSTPANQLPQTRGSHRYQKFVIQSASTKMRDRRFRLLPERTSTTASWLDLSPRRSKLLTTAQVEKAGEMLLLFSETEN